MARKRGPHPFIEGLEITTLAAEGKAMGHHDGVVVFVPMTVPGDIVDVQITKQIGEALRACMQALWRLRRLQVAESSVPNTARLQDTAGVRPACAHRQTRNSRGATLLRFGAATLLPQ